MSDAKLPFGKQFSPAQTPLTDLLDLVVEHEGDRAALEVALAAKFFDGSPAAHQGTLAMNTFLALREYGLIAGDDYAVTDAGKEIAQAANATDAHRSLARHILTDCQGLSLIQVLRARAARGERINVQGVADDLIALGVDPGGARGEKISSLRGWLIEAGVIDKNWQVDDAALEAVLGASGEELEELAALSLELRAFLRALATMSAQPPFNSQTVAAQADMQSGTRMAVLRDLPARVLSPLQDAGWLTFTKTTGGRGAKAYVVQPTQACDDKIAKPLADALVNQANLPDPAMLRRPLADLLADVRDGSKSNHDRGYALEGICIQLMRMLGGHFVGWRLRAHQTGFAEVDVLAELINGRHQLVLMQSKVSAITGRSTIDREVAVGQNLVRCQVILFVSAGAVGPAPRNSADTYMHKTNLAIVFLEGKDLDAIAAGGSIVDPLRREFSHVRAIRREEA